MVSSFASRRALLDGAPSAPASPLTISGTPVNTANRGTAYAGFSATAAGGAGGYTYSIASGTLPPGITINSSTGAVSGTPTGAGVYPAIKIRVTDSAAATADLATFTISCTYTGLVATRARTLESNSGNLKAMSRSVHVATETIIDIKCIFQNFNILSTTTKEVGNGATATVTASIEYPAGTLTQLLFSGSATGNMAAVPGAGATNQNGTVTSDKLTISIPLGATFWVRQFFTSSVGTFYTAVQNSGAGERLTIGGSATDLTLSATLPTQTVGGTSLPPLAIVGTAINASAVLVGDSIMWGYRDALDVNAIQGIIAHGLPAGLAFVNLGSSGSTAGAYLTQVPSRSVVFPYCTDMYSDFGINDLIEVTGVSAATLVGYQQAIIAAFPAGVRGHVTTLTPDSTDTGTGSPTGWTTLGAQVAKTGTAGSRNTYNGLALAGISGFTGATIDVAAASESSLNSGLWALTAGARTVTDAAMTVSTSTLTSATAAFVAGDVGFGVRIAGAGAAGVSKEDYITVRTNGTTVTTSAIASTGVTGATANINANTLDGVHPLPGSYAAFGATIASAVSSSLSMPI